MDRALTMVRAEAPSFRLGTTQGIMGTLSFSNDPALADALHTGLRMTPTQAAYSLPTPKVASPLPPVDPYRHKKAYHRLLSMLFHAEKAALEGFELLNDPLFVEHHPLFAKAAAKLVADEEKHLADIEELLVRLDAGPLLEPSDTEREFWTAWRSGELFALPFKPSVASMFCLFSEGLGYAVLYHLAETTTDPWIKARLWDNVEDEKSHLRLSITVLSRTLAEDPNGFAADAAMYMMGYALIAKKAIREMRPLLDDVGLDFNLVMGSSFAFVADLLQIVVQRTGHASAGWDAMVRVARFFQEHPSTMDLAYASTYLPHPQLVSRAIYEWGARYLAKKGAATTTRAQIAAREAEKAIARPPSRDSLQAYYDARPPRTTIVPPLESGVVLVEGADRAHLEDSDTVAA